MMSINIIVLVIGFSISFLEVDAQTPCELGWQAVGNTCLRFELEQSKSRDDAEKSCRTMDAYLASCLSDAEDDFIEDYLKNSSYVSYYYNAITVLIGDGYWNRDSEFLTNADGTPVTSKRKLDGSSKPYRDFQRCIALAPYTHLVYRYALSCDYPAAYICKKGPTSCGSKYACPTGWIRDIDKCYLQSNTTISYSGAVSRCNSLGGAIFEPNSDYEWRFVLLSSGVYSNQVDYWLAPFARGTWRNSGLSINLPSYAWCDSAPSGTTTRYIFFDEANRYCLRTCPSCNFESKGYICESGARAT